MAATYRTIQTDFSAGEIDPLASLNLNTGLRTIGLALSRNTIHQTSGAVSKRAPSKMLHMDDGISDSLSGKVEIILKDKSVLILISKDGKKVRILTSSESGSSLAEWQGWNAEIDHSNSKWAVYENVICEVNPNFLPYLHTLTYEGNTPQIISVQMQKSQWIYDSYPTSCCFAQGRLLLAFGNTVVASRTPEGDQNRFFDFALADYTYTYVAKIDHGTKSGNPSLSAKSSFHFTTDAKLPEGERTYAEYLALPGLDKCVTVITNTAESIEDSNEVDDNGDIKKQTVAKKVYTITTNFTGGIADYTDIVVRKHITSIGGVAKDLVIEEGTTTYDDWDLSADTHKSSLPAPSIAPMVYSSHAVELVENDLYASDIQWIANLGRVTVATKTAIFIATSDVITPNDFDLTITSYIGASDLPPKVLNSWLIWSSYDRRKLYGAIYSNEIQGLSIVELTSNAHHLFTKGIIDYEMTDLPNQTVYALSEDGDIRVCALIPRNGGYMFSWSSWHMPYETRYIAFSRAAATSHPLIAGVKGEDIPTTALLAVDSREIYQYGENGYELYADAIWNGTLDLQDSEIGVEYSYKLPGEFYRYANAINVFISASDQLEITRREVPRSDGTISLGVLSAGYRSASITIGIPYTMEIALFTQLMPNNSGVALMSKHSISRIDFQLYKSNGGEIKTSDGGSYSILQMVYGKSAYSGSVIDSTGQPVSYTGVYGIDNPNTTGDDDKVRIISSEPYPFNLMAVAQTIRLTEVY